MKYIELYYTTDVRTVRREFVGRDKGFERDDGMLTITSKDGDLFSIPIIRVISVEKRIFED